VAKAIADFEPGALPWEVVYTQEALRTLARADKEMAKATVLAIHKIASGVWNKKSTKQLKGPTNDVLYEAKNLPSGHRLIWSVDIEYSPLQMCYTEVVKVWDLVKHDHVNKVVERLNQKKRVSRKETRQDLLNRLQLEEIIPANDAETTYDNLSLVVVLLSRGCVF